MAAGVITFKRSVHISTERLQSPEGPLFRLNLVIDGKKEETQAVPEKAFQNKKIPLNFSKEGSESSVFQIANNAQLEQFHILLDGSRHLINKGKVEVRVDGEVRTDKVELNPANGQSEIRVGDQVKIGKLVLSTGDDSDHVKIGDDVTTEGLYIETNGGADTVEIGKNFQVVNAASLIELQIPRVQFVTAPGSLDDMRRSKPKPLSVSFDYKGLGSHFNLGDGKDSLTIPKDAQLGTTEKVGVEIEK